MKVNEIKTGKTLEVNDAYGARLIEQGKAKAHFEKVKPVQEPKEVPAAEETREGAKSEEPKPKTTKAAAHKGDAK